jgi:hypothetical protein
MSLADAEAVVNANPEAGSPGPVDPFGKYFEFGLLFPS